jgi:hypothetical protein
MGTDNMELGQADLSEPSPTEQQQGVVNDWEKKQKGHGNESVAARRRPQVTQRSNTHNSQLGKFNKGLGAACGPVRTRNRLIHFPSVRYPSTYKIVDWTEGIVSYRIVIS